MTFKQAALKILEENNTPLHYRDITNQALKNNLIKSDGKTPWSTMVDEILTDILNNGEKSRFIHTDPGFFGIRNPNVKQTTFLTPAETGIRINGNMYRIHDKLSPREKDDIGSSLIAELITQHSDNRLTCYKPVRDHEGITLIVKQKGMPNTVSICVKTTYGYKDKKKGFVSSIKESEIYNDPGMYLVFVYIDLAEGEIYHNLFCIPAPEFIKLTDNNERKTNKRVFAVSLNRMARSKYAEFMIDKKELANKITEIMDRL